MRMAAEPANTELTIRVNAITRLKTNRLRFINPLLSGLAVFQSPHGFGVSALFTYLYGDELKESVRVLLGNWEPVQMNVGRFCKDGDIPCIQILFRVSEKAASQSQNGNVRNEPDMQEDSALGCGKLL